MKHLHLKELNYKIAIFSLIFLCLGFIIGYQVSSGISSTNSNNNQQQEQPFGQNSNQQGSSNSQCGSFGSSSNYN